MKSNCIIAALKVWWRLGGKVYIRRPSKDYLFGHWIVRIGKKTVHFRSIKKLPWYQQFWFEGKLEWN